MPIRTIGEAFTLNTTSEGDQYAAGFTQLAGGGFVAWWHSGEPLESDEYWDVGDPIRARVFDANGNPLGKDFVVNQEQGQPHMPSVLALADGGFIAQWDNGFLGDPEPIVVRTRVFDADGHVRGEEAELGSETALHSSLTRLSDGRFLATWSTWDDIRARILDKDGTPVGEELQINATDTGNENEPMAVALPDGRFLVAWETDQELWEDEIPDVLSVRARVFNADGTPAGGDFQLNTTPTLAEFTTLRSLEALPDGNILATWWTYEADGSRSVVMGRLLDADGRRLGGEFPVALDPPVEDGEGSFEVTELADGRTLATWSIYDERGDILHAQLLDAFGKAISDEFTLDAPKFTRVNACEDGRILLTWSDGDFGDGDGTASRARFFDPTAFSGTDGDDFWTGGFLADRIASGDGDDRLRGRVGDDRLTGGNGDDFLDAGEGNDLVIGKRGDDFLSGWTGDDRLIGGRGADRIEGGAGSDILTGGADADVFVFRSPAAAGRGAGRDVIEDFARGSDTIDLAGIDANTGRSGNQAFAFVAAAAFSETAGELRCKAGILAGDVDGDGGADFQIALTGIARLGAADILL